MSYSSVPDLLQKKPVLAVQKALTAFDPSITLIELDTSGRTAEDAARSLGQPVGAIVKSLIFKNNEDDFYLCLVSGDRYLCMDKLSRLTETSIIKASGNEVKTQTGFSIGGVAPVGHKHPPKCIFMDGHLARFQTVYAAAGHPYVVFGIARYALSEITKATVCDITD